MKKTFLLLSLLILPMVVLLSGCGNKELSSNDFERPDFGQPEVKADIMGVVESVSGNEVTILKIEMPEVNVDGDVQDEATTDESKGTAFTLSTSGDGMRRGGGMGMGERPDGADGSDMVDKIKERATSKETVIVPVGIPMLKPDSDSKQGKMEMIEASLEDIKSNSIITVWLNDEVSDRQIADFVLIR